MSVIRVALLERADDVEGGVPRFLEVSSFSLPLPYSPRPAPLTLLRGQFTTELFGSGVVAS